ncbi:zinc-binding dehydrogenase [Williamsia sp.]|uniref:zinc-binding dehydrogenase n=1 Tax=Williamsia sp. TaxID=1872085 RepID=UPI0025EC80B6|nr:zinc-binding dehydrogenase [Williamsia sp.]
MQVIDTSTPTPPAGHLLIQTEAIGVGGVDAVIRRGTVSGSGFGPGYVPGSEVAGIVTKTGEGVDRIWVGRRVWAFTGVGGGYAEHAIASVGNVVALPEGLSTVDAVALGSAAPVAHFALAQARFTAGESVLVRGASGSIGIAAVELASRGGAGSVTVTASSASRGERLRGYGATHVLDRDGNGEGPGLFDVIIDIVAGSALPRFIERLAPNGRMVLVGVVAGYPPSDFGMTLLGAFQKSLTLSTFSLDTVPAADRDRTRIELFDAAVRGDIHAVVQDVLPLDRAADAHRRMDEGTVFGRLVLRP